MFRASLCPSSGDQEYYTVVAACGILCCVFSSSWSGVELRVMCPVCRMLHHTYKTLVYAAPYLKMLSAAQNYSMANRECVKYNLRFYFCPCFWENLLLSLLNHPLITFSYWPLVSITLTIKLLHLSTWYVRQYSSMSNKVIHSKETNIIFKMTTFCVGPVAQSV